MSENRQMTLEELTTAAQLAGLDLSDAQLAEIHGGYRHIAAMAARVRGVSDRAREAEPDLVFNPRFEDRPQ